VDSSSLSSRLDPPRFLPSLGAKSGQREVACSRLPTTTAIISIPPQLSPSHIIMAEEKDPFYLRSVIGSSSMWRRISLLIPPSCRIALQQLLVRASFFSGHSKPSSLTRTLTLYSTGHMGQHGHEFLEFEYAQGRLRYANNSNYRNDSLIKKESKSGPLACPLSFSVTVCLGRDENVCRGRSDRGCALARRVTRDEVVESAGRLLEGGCLLHTFLASPKTRTRRGKQRHTCGGCRMVEAGTVGRTRSSGARMRHSVYDRPRTRRMSAGGKSGANRSGDMILASIAHQLVWVPLLLAASRLVHYRCECPLTNTTWSFFQCTLARFSSKRSSG
jgi:hypothetical protein